MAHYYEVGTRAWQPEPTEGWVASELKEKIVDGEKVQLVFELENGEVRLFVSIVSRRLQSLTIVFGLDAPENEG